MNINPIVLPIRMWQASMQLWQNVAVAQLQMNRCALTMIGLWPSEKIKSLGAARAKPAATRPEAAPAAVAIKKAETPATVKAEPVKAVKAEKAAPAASAPVPPKVAAAKVTPVTPEAAPAAPAKPVRRKAAAAGQAKPKAAPRRKAPAKTAEPAPLSDTRH